MAEGVRKYWGERSKIKEAMKLALKHRELAKQGHMGVFLLPLVIAIAKDGFLDHLNTVIIGYLLSIPAAIYLFIFMWGRGKWKMRIILLLLTLVDLIPAVSSLPMSTLYVLWGYFFARRQARESIGVIEELGFWVDKTKRQLHLEEQRDRLTQVAQEAFEQQSSPRDDAISENQSESERSYDVKNYYPVIPPSPRKFDMANAKN